MRHEKQEKPGRNRKQSILRDAAEKELRKSPSLISELKNKAPVVIASDYSEAGVANGVMAAGSKGFAQMPYDIKQLFTTIREVLDAD